MYIPHAMDNVNDITGMPVLIYGSNKVVDSNK
jgi:hypothetical protein